LVEAVVRETMVGGGLMPGVPAIYRRGIRRTRIITMAAAMQAMARHHTVAGIHVAAAIRAREATLAVAAMGAEDTAAAAVIDRLPLGGEDRLH
jgi:hypothetical protein